MPLYEYEHSAAASSDHPACSMGEVFTIRQSIHDDRLAACPECGTPVSRLISRPMIMTPKGDTDLRNLGFTKLVKRDTGVYENVTRRGNDARYMEAGKADSIPDISRTITD